MADGTLETLKAAARERWSDGWTIEQLHFADGTTSEYVFHTAGHAEEGLNERERLFVGADDEVYCDRVLIEEPRIVEVLERDEAPPEIQGEIVSDDSERP